MLIVFVSVSSAMFGYFVSITRTQQLDFDYNAPLALCEVKVIGEGNLKLIFYMNLSIYICVCSIYTTL